VTGQGEQRNDDVTEQHYTATDKRCKTSALEEQILGQLRAAGLDIVPQVKRRSWVFDAAVQGTRIFIEINGAYWHSLPHAQERDVRKAEWAAEHGYTIITVTEEAYNDDPNGTIRHVVDAVEQARVVAKVDIVDTNAAHVVSSFFFDDWRDVFVRALGELGNVRHGCLAAGVARATAYKRRETDAEFALAWDEALENFSDLLEGMYARRAMEQSDRAMEFLLKANRREKYGDRLQIDDIAKHIDIMTLSTEQLERLVSGDDLVRILFGG
jgi:very-short-patch-repair endonuclease